MREREKELIRRLLGKQQFPFQGVDHPPEGNAVVNGVHRKHGLCRRD